MNESSANLKRRPKHPPWLKVRAPFGEQVHNLKGLLGSLRLNTVCQESMCPNMGECWSHGVATFMILGDICTRGCRYCAVDKGRPVETDLEEPERVGKAVGRMGLRHVVITSVDRDDLPDGGAGIFAATVRSIRQEAPDCRVELLIPDFGGSRTALETVLHTEPEVLGHNMETVPRLYPMARGGGDYEVSLRVLENAAALGPGIVIKTGLMLGLGETREELVHVMRDIVKRGVQVLTLGQYLRPSAWHLPVVKYYSPEEFLEWAKLARDLGLRHVEAGPLVRSSYLADRQFEAFQSGFAGTPVQLEQT